jgi:primosomal protein N' (replication factor Y)
LRAESRDAAKLDAFLTRAQQLANATVAESALHVWEPVAATLERKAGYVRKQLMVQAPSRKLLQQFLAHWVVALRGADARSVRWTLDVDPIEV